MDISIELPSYCFLHQQSNLIEDKKSIFPKINIQLQGSEPPGEISKKVFSKMHKSFTKPLLFSKPAGAVRNKAFIKMHKNCTKPLSFVKTIGIYLIECSSTRLLIQATIKKKMKSFPNILKTKSSNLANLLSKILTWHSEDRLSLIDIKKHFWLTMLLESKHEALFT